jgi:tetratricopeptide (TPR) repeat protein
MLDDNELTVDDEEDDDDQHEITGRRPWLNLRRASWSILTFFQDWWWSRPWRQLALCFPAMIAVVLITSAVVWGRMLSQDVVLFRYAKSAEAAIKRDDKEMAELCLRKMQALAPENHSAKYHLALMAAREDNLEMARASMRSIATAETGFGPAHFWLAMDILQREGEKTEEELIEARTRLELAIGVLAEPMQARATLAQLYLREGKQRRAAAQLEQVAVEQPATHMAVARLYLSLGDKKKSVEHAEKACTYFEHAVEGEPDDVDNRLWLAQSLALVDDFDKAHSVLVAGVSRTNDERLRKSLSRFYLSRANQLSENEGAQKLEYIQQALALSPDDPDLVARLAPFAMADAPQAAQIREQLHALLAEGHAPAIVHFILGTIATEDGDEQRAILHLEQAYAHNPRMAAVANNLAWVLAKAKEPQLDRALKLAGNAIEAAPNHPELRATRGGIHLELGNWKDALTDLEMALETFPKRASLHEGIAQAYDELGLPDLAEQHRKQISTDEEEAN